MSRHFVLDTPLPAPKPRIADIQRLVAAGFGIPVDAMQQPSRRQAHAKPRMIAMYLADQLSGRSMPEIGAAFARDHTTVMHAAQTIERKRSADPELDAFLVKTSRTLRDGAQLGAAELVDSLETALMHRCQTAIAAVRLALARDPWATLAKLEATFPPDAEQERSA